MDFRTLKKSVMKPETASVASNLQTRYAQPYWPMALTAKKFLQKITAGHLPLHLTTLPNLSPRRSDPNEDAEQEAHLSSFANINVVKERSFWDKLRGRNKPTRNELAQTTVRQVLKNHPDVVDLKYS